MRESPEAPPSRGEPNPLPAGLARRVRLVILDVDGVLSDGAVYVGALPGGEAVELKRFDIQDGLGVRFLQWAGIHVAVVSGRVSRATEIRTRELDIVELHQDGGAQKVPAIQKILDRHGLGWDQVAMLGDDLPDLAVLQKVGCPAVVANATPEVRALAVWKARNAGGHGAVREFCEALLRARGEWERLVNDYVTERGGAPLGGNLEGTADGDPDLVRDGVRDRDMDGLDRPDGERSGS